jgi:hypothetical protein
MHATLLIINQRTTKQQQDIYTSSNNILYATTASTNKQNLTSQLLVNYYEIIASLKLLRSARSLEQHRSHAAVNLLHYNKQQQKSI